VRVNERIRARQVRVVDEESNQLGIMAPGDALNEARERGLDLVEVAPNAQPPVCRIMDYGKYKYQQSKRAKESRKHQHTATVKEVKYRPKIDEHDFNYKTNHAREFLEEGNKVKLTIMFRGREMAHPEFGRDILKRVVDELEDLLSEKVNAGLARLEGRNMSIMLTPAKGLGKKKEKDQAGKGGGKSRGDRQAESEQAKAGQPADEGAAPESPASESPASEDAPGA
jgi:translation initiation factor IF-3